MEAETREHAKMLTDLDLSRMLTCLGGSLASCCGGEVAGDREAEPQLLEPECEEDMELVRCLWPGTCTAPAASLRFTTCARVSSSCGDTGTGVMLTWRPLTNVGSPMVRAGLEFLLLFFLLLFCFSLSLLGPAREGVMATARLQARLSPEVEAGDLGATQLRSFLSWPPPQLQPHAALTRPKPAGRQRLCARCLSDQARPRLVPPSAASSLASHWSKQSLCINLLWEQEALLHTNLTLLDTSKMCSPWPALARSHTNSWNKARHV